MFKQSFALSVLLFLITIGFVPQAANALEWVTTSETVIFNDIEIEIEKTADNFIVLYDSSSSMDEVYKDTGTRKIDLEKAIFKIRNAALPDLKFHAGLYSFTPNAMTVSSTVLKPYYAMKPYNKAEFDKAIDQLPTKASGPTLLIQGLTELKGILSGLKGRTVVFVVTDGSYSKLDKSLDKGELEAPVRPVDIARDLASKYDVSFYAINSSSKNIESKLLKAVASINASSRVITFDQFIQNPLALSGALFVVDARIVQKSVDIEKIIGAKLNQLLFAHNKSDINSDYAAGLQLLGEFLQKTPKAQLEISGFTDSTGTQEYNLGLSRLRAEAIANYLVQKFNIDAGRIVLNWYGESNPVATNDTTEGRALNRRAEGFIFGLD